jgi:uncharacterized delta-60 repeat protein
VLTPPGSFAYHRLMKAFWLSAGILTLASCDGASSNGGNGREGDAGLDAGDDSGTRKPSGDSGFGFSDAGDDGGANAPGSDGGSRDGGADGGGDGDAGPGPFVLPTPVAVALSNEGPDWLISAVPAPNGGFYAAGFSAETPVGTRYVTVVKLTSSGALDPSFSGDGVAITDIAFAGSQDEIDLAVQPTGKLIVAATVAGLNDSRDRDIAIARLDPSSGEYDIDFADLGKGIISLSVAHDTGAGLVGLDTLRSLALDEQGRIFLHAHQRGIGNATAGGPRTDTDFTVVRLTADGTVDNGYAAGATKYVLDIDETSATARGLLVLPDGTAVAAGFANTPQVGNTTQPVLYKLSPLGGLVPGFGTSGVFHKAVLETYTEATGLALHGTSIVTCGAGRSSSVNNQWAVMQFDLTLGTRSSPWGGATDGVVLLDPSGIGLNSNCRNVLALPDGKTVVMGSTGPGNTPEQEAAFAVLTTSGALDTAAYGAGTHAFPFTGNGADQLWGGAVSGENFLLVGYKGAGATQTEASNDDSFALVVPLR